MTNILRYLLLALSLLFSASSVSAMGPYLKGGVGLSSLTNASFDQPGISKEATFKLGYGGVLGAGWKFGLLSAEVEGVYFSNTFSEFSGATKTAAEGDFSAMGVMLNGLCHLGPYGYFEPFFLAGIGGAQLELAGVKDGENDLGDASDTVLAYQAGLGLDAKLTPEMHLEVGYRYLTASDPVFNGTTVSYGAHVGWAALRILLDPPQ